MKALLTCLFALLLCVRLWAANVTGEWTLALIPDFSGHDDSLACVFAQDGQRLTANCGGGSNIQGEVTGQRVTFRVKTGRQNEFTATFTGTLDASDSTMTGTWQLSDTQGAREGRFTATRRPAR